MNNINIDFSDLSEKSIKKSSDSINKILLYIEDKSKLCSNKKDFIEMVNNLPFTSFVNIEHILVRISNKISIRLYYKLYLRNNIIENLLSD